jgi:hypothetical protein
MSISVIVTTYSTERQGTINRILKSWLKEPVDQVWLIDGKNPPILPEDAIIKDTRFEYWPLWRDKGTRTDYALVALTDGDYIILADDDVNPFPGLTMDLLRGLEKFDIVGIMGRTFEGPDYHKNTTYYKANKLTVPMKVDFCGVVMCARRNRFFFDTRGMHRNCDDLWWQMMMNPLDTKGVIPTKHYEDLPFKGMCHDPQLMAVRQAFYEYWYKEYYAGNKVPISNKHS